MRIKTLKGCHLLTMGKVHRKKKVTNINRALTGRNTKSGDNVALGITPRQGFLQSNSFDS